MLKTSLRTLRESSRLNQEQIAEKLNVDRTTYTSWEIGRKIIPLKHLNTLSNFYNVTLDYITELTDDNKYDKTYNKNNLDRKLIGKRLREVRNQNKLTQKQVAKHLNTTHSTISAYESGKTLIITAFIIDFAKLTNTSIDYLCGKSDNATIK